jgi:ubiquinone/menaquinone biosynthesis C-methylase UbiE
MDAQLRRRLEASGYSESGFADRYDAARPRPPAALKTLLAPLLPHWPPRMVVDLGSGTGLSTRYWADSAGDVVGVEPNADMCDWAQRHTRETSVRYVNAPGEATGLDSGIADLVTAAQSLQWMEPDGVVPEIYRLLRPGGVLCAYQYASLQTPDWSLEAAWARVRDRVGRLRAERGLDDELRLWPVSRESLEAPGLLVDVRETVAHSVEEGDGARLLAFALSEGSLRTLLAGGATEEEIGLDDLRRAAARVVTPVHWWIGYRVWLARRD